MNFKNILIKISQYKYLIFFVFQLFFLIGHAFAGTTAFGNDIFTPSSQDSSLAILQELFGQLISGNFGGTSADPLLGGIKAFNGAVLTVGGILVAYTVVYGTIGTAHDGEMLGKKFSSVWIPIRTSIGAALVLPIVGGGYCLMQVIVMWLVVQGVGLADQVWGSYVTNIPSSALLKNLPQAQVAPQNVQDLVNNVFQMTTCMEANKLEASYTTDPSQSSYAQAIGSAIINLGEGTVGQNFGVSTYPDKANNTTDYGFGITGTSALGKAAAAAVTVVGDPVAAIGGLSSASLSQQICGTVKGVPITTPDTASKTGMFDDYVLADLSPLQTAKNTALVNLISSSINLSDNLSNSVIQSDKSPPTPPTYTDLQAEALNYYTAEVNAANTILNPNNPSGPFKDIINATNLHGWLYAGSFFNQLINFNNTVNSSINQLPSTNTPKGVVPLLGANGFSNNLNKINENMHNLINGYNSASNTTVPNVTKKEKENIQENQTTDTGEIGKILAKVFTGNDLNSLQGDTRNPLIILSSMGSWLIVSVSTLMLISAGASVGFLGFSAGAGIAIMMLPIVAFLLSIAFTVGYLIPFMPFMIFTGAAFGWLIMVVEAIIAAPLWAVMHLHPEGHDVSGHGHSGYMLVLGLLLRPVLLIFGFISSVALITPIGHFINSIFFSAFASSQQGAIGFWGELFGLGIYTGFMYTTVKTIFSVIHRIPDQLLRWIGGGGDQLGEFAQEHSRGGQAGGVAVGSALGTSIAQGGNQLGNMALQSQQNNKQLKNGIEQTKNFATGLVGDSGSSTVGNIVENTKGNLENKATVSNAFKENMATLAQQGGPKLAHAFTEKVQEALSTNQMPQDSFGAIKKMGEISRELTGNILSSDKMNGGVGSSGASGGTTPVANTDSRQGELFPNPANAGGSQNDKPE